jgi:hypothetical protein
MLCGAPHPCIMTNDHLGVPVEHHDDVDPPKALDQDFGHIDAPPLIGPGWFGFALPSRPLGFESQIGGHPEAMRSHQAQDALLVDWPPLDKVQVGPDATVAPKRMLSFELTYPLRQAFVALGHQGRGLPAHPSTSSLFLPPG